jgi:hypothetical protein
MTLPLILVAIVAAAAVLVAIGWLIAWHPVKATHRTTLVASTSDWCEHTNPDGTSARCPAPATHELAASLTHHGDMGSSAMVATFCALHAPDGARPIS